MSPGTGRSPRRQVRLPDDLDEALIARAQSEGSTVSAVVRAAISEYLRAS
jgi:predicted DNA-binding protein